jgi:hypothetical protein
LIVLEKLRRLCGSRSFILHVIADSGFSSEIDLIPLHVSLCWCVLLCVLIKVVMTSGCCSRKPRRSGEVAAGPKGGAGCVVGACSCLLNVHQANIEMRAPYMKVTHNVLKSTILVQPTLRVFATHKLCFWLCVLFVALV